MTAQTVYTKPLAQGLPGLLYDMGNTDIDSFASEGEVPFGAFCARGTDKENQVVVGTAAAIGVATRTAQEQPFAPAGAFAGDKYNDEETVGVLRSGYIWAIFDAVGGTVGAAVTINAGGEVVAAGGGTALTAVKAVIEKPATDASIHTSGVFVGVVQVFPI